MSSSLLLMEPMGGSFGRFLPAGRSARIGAWRPVVATGGLDLPGSLSSRGARGMGVRGSWGLALYVPGTAPVDPGYIDSGSGLEFATCLLSADDEEVLMLRLECVTQRFLPLTSPSPGGELLAVFRSPTVFFRWLDAIRDYLLPLYQMIDFGKVGHVAARWMDTRFSTHKGFLIQWLYLQKASGQGVRMHPPMMLLAMVLVGALSSYEWLSETMVGDAAVRDRGKRLCRMIVGSDLLSLPLTIYIRMDHAEYPDVFVETTRVSTLPASFALPWIGEAETLFVFPWGFRIGIAPYVSVGESG
ncbi:hypothetical protein CK203_055084 [Vitis vinifera]|uniref:Uncharacterized protein n=1 Tax=Vitis vinifera TaxID=29760 RepID=A0A438GUF5_VITVI|nr:hypothetical protein CK203_055084 [Vitis vinifera]